MAGLIRAHDGELLEELVMRHYGRQPESLVKLVRDHVENRFLTRPDAPKRLSMDHQVWCPDAPMTDAQRIRPHSDNLWD